MKFDGHIVGIIELRDHKPLKDTNVDERNCYKQNIIPSKNHNEHLAGLFIYSFLLHFLVIVIYLISLLICYVNSEFKKHETNMSFTKTDLKGQFYTLFDFCMAHFCYLKHPQWLTYTINNNWLRQKEK